MGVSVPGPGPAPASVSAPDGRLATSPCPRCDLQTTVSSTCANPERRVGGELRCVYACARACVCDRGGGRGAGWRPGAASMDAA